MRKINFVGRNEKSAKRADPANRKACGRPGGRIIWQRCLAVIGVVGWATVATSGRQAQPVQVLETPALMEELFQPLYGELTRAVAKEPANRQAWRAVLSPAAKLAELHNLLYSRKDQEYTQKPEWPQQAAASQKLMIALLEAVRKQNYANVRKQYEAAVDGCNACHNKSDPDAPLLKAYDPEIQK